MTLKFRLASTIAAFLLLGISFGEPASAQAVVCSEAEDEVFEYLFDLIGYSVDRIADSDPSEDDCEHSCRRAVTSCRQLSNKLILAMRDERGGIDAISRILCNTTPDPKGCKDSVRDEKKDFSALIRIFKSDLLDACRSDDFKVACHQICETDVDPANCCEVFGECAAPTATPTSAPTATPTSAPTATPTSAPTATPTSAPTATPTAMPTTLPPVT
jgi:hypothetical protein